MAKTASAPFVTMSEVMLEKDDIAMLLEQFRDDNFPDEAAAEVHEAQYLVNYVGKIGYIQLGFAHQGIVFVHDNAPRGTSATSSCWSSWKTSETSFSEMTRTKKKGECFRSTAVSPQAIPSDPAFPAPNGSCPRRILPPRRWRRAPDYLSCGRAAGGTRHTHPRRVLISSLIPASNTCSILTPCKAWPRPSLGFRRPSAAGHILIYGDDESMAPRPSFCSRRPSRCSAAR